MTDINILTSLLVPVTTNGPSSLTLQWSEDGQLFILTRAAVYILTPNSGLNFEPSSVITAAFQPIEQNVKVEPLSWYRTMIELERTPTHHWALEAQEWGAVSLGSLDMSWSTIALSPTNLSEGACCLMAALNTNLEVSLWAPRKNHLTGEWTKIQDITQAIKDSEITLPTAIQKTLNAQVQSISWSQQVDLGEESHYVDGSLLAMGNRAGRVVFMRLSSTGTSQGLQHVATLDVADDWIQQLAWSPWRKVAVDQFDASLACGMPDGDITIVSASLLLENSTHQSLPVPRFDFKLQEAGKSYGPPDGSGITALTWLVSKRHAPILAYTKPGIVCLRAFPSELPLGWTGSYVLALQLQPTSSSSTPYAAASGFVHYEQHDALLVSLYDGSIHIIHGISTSPSIDTSGNILSSEELTRQVRTAFRLTEGKVSFSDANRTSGIVDYDGSGTLAWLHEKCRPDDFSYKHDAKHESRFIATCLWKDGMFILEQLASQLTRDININAAPAHVLRGAFLQLRDSAFLKTHQSRIFKLLVQPQVTPSLPLAQSPADSAETFKINFRHRLATSLFRRNDIHCLRLKLAIAHFCSHVQSVQGSDLSPFGSLANEFTKSILCMQLQTVIHQMDCVISQLDDNDRSFVHRWITQSLTQASPHLQEAALALARSTSVPADSLLESREFQEQCPACRAIIPLGISSNAICPNGHTWTRCSVTYFILSTPYVRTCVGCCRKALLPPSQHPPDQNDSIGLALFPPAASSWLVHELLEAVRSCIFCGNKFVRVL